MRSIRSPMLLFVVLLIPTFASAQPLWCEDTDALHVSYDPQLDEILLRHTAAMYNCCPEPISHSVMAIDQTLFVVEHVGADPPCDCNCCLDLEVRIAAPPAGEWQIDFAWWDLESGEWRHLYDVVTVPAPGHAGPLDDPESWFSDCLEGPVSADALSWGGIKAVYH